MRNIKKKIILLILFIICNANIFALDIEISGFRNNNGNVLVLLFNSENGFPDNPQKAYRKYTVKINNKKVTISDSTLKSGNYSISVLHDENYDNKLEKNWLGLPKEGIGFSNNTSITFGAPSFKSCFTDITKKINILIKYF